jgi:hypothetical protein
MIEARRNTYHDWIREFEKLHQYYAKWPKNGSDDLSPTLHNPWFSGLDAVALYGILVNRNPKTYVEIGSGESTKIARQAIQDKGLRTKIVSIDPQPRAFIDSLCDDVIRSSFEDAAEIFLSSLHPGDVILMDGSHRCFQNSDVTVFFTEVIPGLPGDTMYGFHDIFLLGDYPPAWQERFYNEQYLLIAYLLGGAGGDTIEMPLKYISEDPELSRHAAEVLKSSSERDNILDGSAFWLYRPPS